MANLISYQTGALTGATTWKKTETGTAAEKATLAVANSTNTTASDVYNADAQDFTVTNLDVIEGLLLYCKRVNTTGTVRVTLSADSGTTATRTVTVNASDLPVDPSWVFFKFASTLTGDGGTDYAIAIQGSSAGNATFYRATSTAADWNHLLRTDQIQNPAAAGDNLYVVGDWTAAATGSTYTVTMDDTASTDYGTCDVGQNGILSYGTTAATNYTFKLSGNMNVWGGGTFNIGTTGTPIPRGSTALLNFDCTTNVEFGLIINNGGTWNSQGLSRTSGKDIVSCKLNTDEAANSTSLGVDTDTGWLDNDVIAVASTTRTASQCEAGALNGAAGASSLTVDGFAGTGGGLLNAHSGTSPTQAEVIMLTRSILIQGASASLQSYIVLGGTGGATVVDVDWTEFKWLGSATTNKRGIDIGTTTGSCDIQFSSLHDFSVASSFGINYLASSGNGFVFSNNVTFNIHTNHISANNTVVTWTVNNCIFMLNVSGIICDFTLATAIFTNNTVIGAATNGILLHGSFNTVNTINNTIIHSCNTSGIADSAQGFNGTISNTTIWRCNNIGLNFASLHVNLIFDGLILFGNFGSNMSITGGANMKFIGFVSNGDSTFSTVNGVVIQGAVYSNVYFYSPSMSVVSGIKTAHTNDISCGTFAGNIILQNALLNGTNEVITQTSMFDNSYLGSEKHDQTAGLHKTWKKYGTITIDTTAGMFNTASPSERLTPNNASNKLISGIKKAAVANGAALTASVFVRESVSGDGADYNGNRVRLIVKRNDAVGITADTVIATATVASEGAFEKISGTTATATDNGVMEFYVDCDGTTGWINDDDWSIA